MLDVFAAIDDPWARFPQCKNPGTDTRSVSHRSASGVIHSPCWPLNRKTEYSGFPVPVIDRPAALAFTFWSGVGSWLQYLAFCPGDRQYAYHLRTQLVQAGSARFICLSSAWSVACHAQLTRCCASFAPAPKDRVEHVRNLPAAVLTSLAALANGFDDGSCRHVSDTIARPTQLNLHVSTAFTFLNAYLS